LTGPGRPLNKASAVNARRHRLRWVTPRRGSAPRRRWRRRRTTHRVRPGRPGRPVRATRVTFVLTRNNFWGTVHRRGRLVRSWSAGQMPNSEGSKRGRPTAAGDVADRVGRYLRVRRSRRSHRAARRVHYFHRRPPRRLRRWQHRRFVRARRRLWRLELHLVNWCRHRNWRLAWRKVWGLTRGRRRRVRVRVNPVRPHNGLRPRRRRRK
jgi:hypothetical protein